ncbi:VOC family protein [Reichenbachiella faecimaris]|uniref:hypothetical protein n=1 Tax=Reichenbachiella faecimaris TaxID=692418 RepID=UPI0009FDEE84|nr:hypothetical protein [Reichenbachiella faecimaris]
MTKNSLIMIIPYLVFPTQELKIKVFNQLAEEGQVLFPLDEHFGMLKDKYGMQWMMVHKD